MSKQMWHCSDFCLTKFRKLDILFLESCMHEMVKPCGYGDEITYPAKTLYTLVTCSYEINDARTFLFAVEVDEDGNQIQPDDVFLQRMDDLMGDKAQETAGETVQETADQAKESQ